jgi:Domain of unknown function (DUF4124)
VSRAADLCLCLALLLAPLGAQAQMYKCADEHGKTRYSDQPGAGCKEIDIRPSPPLSGALQNRDESFAVQDAELKRRQLEREAADAKDASERDALQRRCAALRREQTVLGSGVRISNVNAAGDLVYMDDTTRERRLAELARELRNCP